MREIKFRAWDKVLNEFLPNVQNHINDKEWAFGSMLKDDRWVIEQFTGLKDKNGKECYEKDYDADGNMIDWCERCCGYQFFQIDIPTKDIIFCQNCEGNFMLQDHIGDFEIIGNIHSNPSLLTIHP